MPSILSKSKSKSKTHSQPDYHSDGMVFWIPLNIISLIKRLYGKDIFTIPKDLLNKPTKIAKIIESKSANGLNISNVHCEVLPVIFNKYNNKSKDIRFLSDGLLNHMNYTVVYNDRKRLAEWICPILNKRIIIYDDSLPLISN